MTSNQQITLVRGLGLIAAISVIIGNVIGTGVFLKTRVMTCNVGTPGYVLLAWIVAGVLSLAGALTYAELTAMMPRAGGEYNFLKTAYGRLWGFLFGWAQIFIIRTGSQAAVAVAFGAFLDQLLGGKFKQVLFTTDALGFKYEFSTLQIVGLSLIVLFTIINCASVSVSGQIATFLTFIKIALVVGLGMGAFMLADGNFANFTQTAVAGACEGVTETARFGAAGYSFTAGFGAAMIAALWGYDGWNNLTLVAGEVKNPQRNIPIALIGATALIIALYVFVNVAYFYVLTPQEIADVSKDSSVAIEVATRFMGGVVVSLMSLALMASSVGTLHTSVLSSARIPYAMARDGLFFQSLSAISPRTRVPIKALVMQAIWACVLVMSGSFDALTDYAIFGSWIFYFLATASIFVFRRKMPDAERPYKAFGYPVIPILFLLVTGWLLFNTLFTSPKESIFGIILILIGLPVYYYLSRQNAHLPENVEDEEDFS
ncbi:MAG TPA: amino acid permease [Pyrinomonadaceae bacterium]|jgi:APA family basic amino acid/polyamine antiporter